MATDPIVQGLDISRSLLATIDQHIKDQILGSFLDVLPGVDVIARGIESDLASTEQVIFNAEQAIKTQIEPAIKAGIPDALALAASLASSLDTHLTQLLSNIATTEDVLGTAIAAARTHAPELAGFILNDVAGAFGNIALQTLKVMEGQERTGVDMLLDDLLNIPNAPAYFTELVTGFRNRGAEWQALALPAILVGVLIGVVEASQEPVSTETRQIAFARLPTKVTPPETMIDLVTKGLVTPEQTFRELRFSGFDTDPVNRFIESRQERLAPMDAANMSFRQIIDRSTALAEMHKHGLTPDYANWILALAERLPAEDTIRAGLLRGEITQDTHDQLLASWGYSPSTAAMMQAQYFYIPPVPDIIHMGIRNVFNPLIVERFTLDGDYPQPFEDAARQQGVSPEWAHKYWQAHWIMPGREAFFEMFQRTVDTPLEANADTIELEDGTHVYNIIGRDTLNLALRDVDTPPFYRDKLTQIAYRTLTRIDIRRLHKVGLLSKAQVERAYLDLGNTPEHARLLAEFVVRLNATTTKDQAKTLVTGIQREVLRLFIQDKISEDQVKPTLADLGFSDAEITLYLEEAKLVRASEYATALETGIGRLFSTGRITDKDAIQRLRDAGLPDDAIHTLMSKWELQIEFRELPAHVVTHRELTATEILESLVDGIIDEPTAEVMLEHVGYDKDSADARIGLSLYKTARATRKVQIDAIKASFVNGVIEQLEASNRLDALYVPADQRDAYLAEWTLARETRTERIPIATLRDMLKGKYLEEADVMQHLKRHRFTDNDAELLVKFWLAQPAPKRLVSVSGT